MKFLLLLLAFPFLNEADCKKKHLPENEKKMPECVEETIKQIGKQSLDRGPLQVEEYLFQNKTVYLFTSPCCDQYNFLYDENCKLICAPTGGFTGKGDEKCPDFVKDAKLVKIVWKKKIETEN